MFSFASRLLFFATRARLVGLLLLWGAVSVAEPASAALTTRTIFVELFVDDEETTLPELWQAKLSNRLLAANEVLARYCDVRFVPLKFARWDSDDRLRELERSLHEFEHEVRPALGNIAIGFSSQYRFSVGRNSLGGTRGPMRAHVLIRENAKQIHEPEKVEVLVHELGHFLGAAHSIHPRSAMRPVLGDGRARAVGYQIGFDAQNAKILKLVSKEIRERSIRRFWHLSEPTLQQLRVEYAELDKQQPSDPAAKQFLKSVDQALNEHRRRRRPGATARQQREQVFRSKISKPPAEPAIQFPSG